MTSVRPHMPGRVGTAASVLLAMVLAGAVLHLSQTSGGDVRAAPSLADPAGTAAETTGTILPASPPVSKGAESPEALASEDDALAPSLRDSLADGSIVFEHGQLRLDLDLRRRFDYYLSAIGELSAEQIRARLERDLTELLPDQRAQVLSAFDRYVALLTEIDQRAWQWAGLGPKQQLAALAALRRERLGESQAEAFFAIDEQRAAHALAERELRSADLSPEEYAVRRAALRDSLPEALQAELAEADLSESAALVTPASPDASSEQGQATLLRQQALAQERADWARRVAAYQVFRDGFPATLSADQQAQRDRYLAREFLPAERRRIEALEAIGQLSASVNAP